MDRLASTIADKTKPSQVRLLIDGEWVDGSGQRATLLDKFRLQAIATIGAADATQVRQTVDAAYAAFRKGPMLAYDRGAVLERAAILVEERFADFVRTMQLEAGFTLTDATGETKRCIQTLRLSAEEARRMVGDVIPLDGAPMHCETAA
jgi:succinate-semialdehyde dehydrogenase/glutarate-semialdehyde dehydrogenase